MFLCQPGTPSMNHTVTIGTKQRDILYPCLFTGFQLRNWLCVVTFYKLLTNFTIMRLKIKTADFACQMSMLFQIPLFCQ